MTATTTTTTATTTTSPTTSPPPDPKLPKLFNCLPRPKPFSYLPPKSVILIISLILLNILLWLCIIPLLHQTPSLITPSVLSYTLGLRHALDADHIAAIDLTTRHLVASGQRPIAVGTFFSLGHSAVVIITCIAVAATAGALRDKFEDFSRVGGIIGTSVSAAFLLLLCAANAWVMWKLVRRLRTILREEQRRGGEIEDEEARAPATTSLFEGVGCLSRLFRALFKVVDRSWKMLPLGFLFGLGFDTSSEIAVLGIASIEAVKGRSLWVILVFPALFTAGMCMLDTIDGSLMMVLYTSKVFSRDRVAILYYSIVLTGITILVSFFIGVVQLLSLVYHVKGEPEGGGWDGIASIGDHSGIIGGCVCGIFLLIGIGSAMAYKPWKRKVLSRQEEMTESSP